MAGDKDLTAPQSTPGKARATLGQIRLMYGALEIDGDTVIRTGMYSREVWRRVSGTGPKAIYEREGNT